MRVEGKDRMASRAVSGVGTAEQLPVELSQAHGSWRRLFTWTSAGRKRQGWPRAEGAGALP